MEILPLPSNTENGTIPTGVHPDAYSVSSITHASHRDESSVPVVHIMNCHPHGRVEVVAGAASERMARFFPFLGHQIQSYRCLRGKSWARTPSGVLVAPFKHSHSVKSSSMAIIGTIEWPNRECTFFVAMQFVRNEPEIGIYAAHPVHSSCLPKASRQDVRDLDEAVDRLVAEAMTRMRESIPRHMRELRRLAVRAAQSLPRLLERRRRAAAAAAASAGKPMPR